MLMCCANGGGLPCSCPVFAFAVQVHQNSPVISTHKSVPLERRYIGSSTTPRRNSTSSVSLISPPLSKTTMHQKPPVNGITIPTNTASVLLREHRKLDRSLSEPVERNQQQQQPRPNQANSSRYKTELCRPFEENGTCKYGDKCQFAHGSHELRTLTRHPKYKTELCRTFHTTGFCPYGPRCHFIHNSEESKKSLLSNLQAGPQQSPPSPPSPPLCNGNGTGPAVPPAHPTRPKALSVGSFSIGSAGELSPPSSQSGSPTSLHSFFTDDAFVFSPTTPNGTNGIANAFAFSQDFAATVVSSPLKSHRQQGAHLTNGFGGSQPALGGSPPSAPYLGNDLSEAVTRDTLFTFPGIDSTNPTLIPSPPSPVDSLPEVDVLAGLVTSPVPATGSNSAGCNSAGSNSPGGPRLPIFARIATSGDD